MQVSLLRDNKDYPKTSSVPAVAIIGSLGFVLDHEENILYMRSLISKASPKRYETTYT